MFFSFRSTKQHENGFRRFFGVTANSLLALFVLTGCDKLGAYNTWQAGSYEPDFNGLSYGHDIRQVVDLYLPNRTARPAPLLIWLYGGSWNSGDRAKYAFIAKRFNQLGYAVAIPDYRLFPDVRFPAFLEDTASAIGFLSHYAAQNPDQLQQSPVILAGHSAGAYNAVQVVADQNYLKSVGLPPSHIAGVIGLSGPYDFYPYDVRATQNAFGDTPPERSQPVAMDLTSMPPLLLITGNRDQTVFPRNSRKLADLAPDAIYVEIEDTGHAGTLIALGFYLTTNKSVLDPVEQFLRDQLPSLPQR